ncbi:serine/threonine-protein kinase SRPK3 [Stagonosporopsis vannaccii]|nr:serine/threonine-protein kinase SRPK3 [Stagonosporopsis vannaccii]
MDVIFRLTRNLFRRTPWTELRFPTSGFEIISDEYLLEEEALEEFESGAFYPTTIGETINSRYQIVGKLGYGTTSTVWLARDLPNRSYATLKVYSRTLQTINEFETYQRLAEQNRSHSGHKNVRTAIDTFKIARTGGDHQCLVQKPVWDSFSDVLDRNPAHRLSPELLRLSLIQVFCALDYVHTECNIVHTDIKAANIFIELDDEEVLEGFVEGELRYPAPRKIGEKPVYASRIFGVPDRWGPVVLGDFGAAVRGNKSRTHDAQPNIYRCPEVMLGTEWSYPADIWNVGAMIWDIYENAHLFHGNHPDGSGYKTAAHLAEVVAMLGPPPLDLLGRGLRSNEFFDGAGNWIGNALIPESSSLESCEITLTGQEQREFLEFVRCMLQWKPEDRLTARQLLDHPWLKAPKSKEILTHGVPK